MPDFKAYLQGFLKVTHTQAFPSGTTPITIIEGESANAWTVFTTYTAPSDGYVTITGKSANGLGATASYVLVDNIRLPTALIVPESGSYTTYTMVKKGEQVRIAGDDIQNVSATFIPALGAT